MAVTVERKKMPDAATLNINYEFHPLSYLMPMIERKDFESLKEDIRKNGIIVPIKIFEGKILDGRNRYTAAKAVGHKFIGKNFEDFVGTYEQAESYVLSANLQRRQMT